MGLKKGQTNNPNGRPSDPNVILLREAIRSNLNDKVRIQKLFDCLDNLNGMQYIEYYLRIQKDVLPPMQAEIPDSGEAERSIVSIFESITEILANSKNKENQPKDIKLVGRRKTA